ncbi:RDD family protein [Ideonella sp.]|uniref:RDD family protein n=1 Tax=Ideonella sp. TaxID=1929293 RepID=UPI003BB74F9A
MADAAEQVEAGALAGRGTRFWAAMIDSVLLIALMFGGAKLLGIDLLKQAENGATGNLLIFAASVAVNLLLQGWLLYSRSQTIGKFALGIRIVRVDGGHANIGRTLGLRLLVITALSLIPFVGQLIGTIDALMIFGKSRRCLHDLIAGTVVVKA